MDFHEISYLCTFLQSVQKKNQVWLIADSGPGSSVGIATVYGLDGPGIESLWGWDIPHLSRLALGPTQPPVQWSTGSFPGVKSGRGVTLTPHPLLMLWSRKGRAIPLLPLWAVRPVQSLSACTRVRFTFTFFQGFIFFVTSSDLRPYFRSDLLLKGRILYELFISQSAFYSPWSNLNVIVVTADEKYTVEPQIKQDCVVSSEVLFFLT